MQGRAVFFDDLGHRLLDRLAGRVRAGGHHLAGGELPQDRRPLVRLPLRPAVCAEIAGMLFRSSDSSLP
jgi:hypothetical protein